MFDYSSKKITVEQALEKVKSSDVITVGMAGAEPVEFLTRLHTIADRVEDVTITGCLPTVMGEYLQEKYLEKAFKIENWFFSPILRRLQHTGRVSFIPNCLHYAGKKRNEAVRTNIFICSASLPDEDGMFHFSCGNVYEKEVAEQADLVILEISPNIPRVGGDGVLHFSEVDHIVEADYFLPVLPDVVSNEKDEAIGRQIADLIHDGDTIQIGIGGIPNAVCAAIHDKRDLGVHTEMLTTGIMRLMKSGAVNNSKKTLKPGKSVFAFLLGTQELYEFAHENPDLLMMNGAWTNHPAVIAQNDNMVSINTSIEIDLTGQCCSESLGHQQISGTGGQSDTAIGAQEAKNGRSVIALYSTATLKDRETGEVTEVSKIVPFLKPGAAVSLSRNDVDYVVTEYGCVRLRGLSVRARAEKLISIAHPKFREELRQTARELGYWI